ncbi:hypothetical protein L1887_02259 [Cichorium endivia]|nr:hypothetical protein L1887_02259 [Cichorium endivia]
MAASSSSSTSFSSRQKDDLQLKHPCGCGLPSRLKTSRTPANPGRKFRVCPNSLKEKGPKCDFWEWADVETQEIKRDKEDTEDSIKGTEDSSKKDEIGIFNLMLKMSALEHEINICKMKMEEEKLSVRQELEKLNSKIFTQKIVILVMFLLLAYNVL